jgi:broad specificity phosphatase PhoE
MVYLVRHAHAGSKAAWEGPDLARPLSPTGRSQAAGLVAQLRGYPVRRILSSLADRCRQTVEPLSRQRGLAVETTDLIGQVFDRLVAEGLDLGGRPRWPRGSTRMLDPDGGHVAEASYLGPLVSC